MKGSIMKAGQEKTSIAKKQAWKGESVQNGRMSRRDTYGKKERRNTKNKKWKRKHVQK